MFLKFRQPKKPIFISLSPNVEKDDIWLALRLLFCPWKWKKDKAVKVLEDRFSQYLGIDKVFAFNSGRSAFMAILKSLGLNQGDEVLLQAFTCNAAVNPIIWTGLKPVFVDIEKETLNISPEDLERKITPRSRAVVVQHTFGLPAKLDKIQEICQKHNLILIEDCAHSLGAKYQGKPLGTFGKAAFFSLGRDKIISSVYGGAAVAQDNDLANKLKEFQKQLPKPSFCWIGQQLLHPVLTKVLIMPLYAFWGLGKYGLIACQKLGILSKAVHKKEKQGKKPQYLPKKMPNALALLALNQLKKLKRFNQYRAEIAKIYDELGKGARISSQERVYMRYPILMETINTDKVLKYFQKKNIYLDDGWRKAVVVPQDTDLEKMAYKQGTCPTAEEVAKKILNLPTHINISPAQAKRIKDLLDQFNKYEPD